MSWFWVIKLIVMGLGGLLVRADGWGPENAAVAAKWSKLKIALAESFNAWTCSALFALLIFAVTGFSNPWTLVSGLAFLIWRLPGFHGWQDWWAMFYRGAWTSLIGFTALSFAIDGHPFYGWLFIPMGCAMALAYCGSYKWLLGKIEDNNVHITAEITSGIAFTYFVLLIVHA